MVKLLLEQDLICLFITVHIYSKNIPRQYFSGLIVNSFPLLTVVYMCICCQMMTHLTVTFADCCIIHVYLLSDDECEL